MLNPNQRTEIKSNFSEESKSLILNIFRKKWQTVANTVFRHPEVKSKLLKSLQHAVDAEFIEYYKDTRKSILLAKSPKEIAEFTNEKFLEEVHLSCPYWEAAIKGASGVENLSSSESGSKINALALSSAAVARARNQKMPALAYRMSTILFHSGAESVDIDRMSKLGVSMSAESTVEFQRKMGENCKSKLLTWKAEIERVKHSILFLQNVMKNQTGKESAPDMSVSAVKDYRYFDDDVHKDCKDLLASIAQGGVLTFSVVTAAIVQLRGTMLPEYK